MMQVTIDPQPLRATGPEAKDPSRLVATCVKGAWFRMPSHDEKVDDWGGACSLAVECEIIRLRLPAKPIRLGVAG
jgi:hypothetical protein